MALTDLPAEILQYIASYLTDEYEISCLAQTNRQLHHLLDRVLYKHNIQHSGSWALEWACVYGSELVARKMLELGAPPDACVDEDWKPLANAARLGHASIVRLFLEKGVDPDPAGEWSHPDYVEGNGEHLLKCPLNLAAENGHESVVRALLDHGVDPEPPKRLPRLSPFNMAVAGGHVPVAKLLRDRASQLRGSKQPDRTSVALAVEHEHDDMLRYLLDVGADLGTLSDQFGWVEFAVDMDRVDLVRILLARGVGVEYEMRSDSEEAIEGYVSPEGPAMVEYAASQLDVDSIVESQGDAANFLLHVAAQHGAAGLVERLLRSGCDPNMTLLPTTWVPRFRPSDLMEPLAAWTGNLQIVRLLLEAGARKDDLLKRVLIDAICGGHTRVVELLLDHGVNPDTLETWGYPVINCTIQHEETFHLLLDRLQRLLDSGYPLEGGLFDSVLQLGVFNGAAMLQFLLSRGVRADQSNIDDERWFEFAIQTGKASVVQVFLDHGFGANLFGINGWRPLQKVYGGPRHYGRAEAMLDLLVRYGADINATTSDEFNEPILTYYIEMADSREYDKFIRLLLRKGADPLAGDPIGRTPLAAAVRTDDHGIVRALLDAIPDSAPSLGRMKEIMDHLEEDPRGRYTPQMRTILEEFYHRRMGSP